MYAKTKEKLVVKNLSFCNRASIALGRVMMRKNILYLFVCLFFITGHFSHAGSSLTVRCAPAYPFKFIDAAGQLQGLEVELATALLENAGITPLFVDYPWTRAITKLEMGKLDILMNFSKNEKRMEWAHYLGISTYEKTILVVRKENSELKIEHLDDFTKPGINFGIRNDFFYSQEFSERYEKDKNFRSHFSPVFHAANQMINLKKVAGGRITGCFSDIYLVAKQFVSSDEFNDLVVLETPVFEKSPVYFGVTKKIDPKIYRLLQKSYKELEQDGTFERIRENWVGKILMPEINECE